MSNRYTKLDNPDYAISGRMIVVSLLSSLALVSVMVAGIKLDYIVPHDNKVAPESDDTLIVTSAFKNAACREAGYDVNTIGLLLVRSDNGRSRAVIECFDEDLQASFSVQDGTIRTISYDAVVKAMQKPAR